MDISSVSNASHNRPVTESKSSSDRQYNDETQAANEQNKAQERAQERRRVQQRLEQSNAENQRRLDGRLVSFGPSQNEESSEQTQNSFNRSRVNEAYSPPKDNLTNAHKQQEQESNNDAIDIVI